MKNGKSAELKKEYELKQKELFFRLLYNEQKIQYEKKNLKTSFEQSEHYKRLCEKYFPIREYFLTLYLKN